MWKSHNRTARAPEPPAIVHYPSRETSLVDQFHVAILDGKLHRIRDIFSKGIIPVDIYNEDGQTGLFCAAFKGLADVVALLLSLGAKPNARCQPEQCTPVHAACYSGSTRALKSLLQAGGDLRLCDSNIRTPIDWCYLQYDLSKVQGMVVTIEEARNFLRETDPVRILKELQTSFSTRKRKSIFGRLKEFIRPRWRNRREPLLNLQDTSNKIHSTGFGKVYLGSGQKSAAVIGLPYISETNDLEIENDENNNRSWTCGKFTSFSSRRWIQRRTPVSVRELNEMSGKDSIPDILINELEVRSNLHHPNLLMLLGVCQTQKCDSLSLVFENVQLGSLHSILHSGKFSLNDKFKKEIVIQISEALDYVHSLGIVHCAVTSHSVMLMNKKQAKLSCFEYALPENAYTEESQSWKHPILTSDAHLNVLRHWMAPEVLLKQHFSVRGDIYSLTCVMWELCHEDIPWRHFSLATLRKLFSDTQQKLPISTNSTDWEHIFELGLRTKKSDRVIEIEEILDLMNKNSGAQQPITTAEDVVDSRMDNFPPASCKTSSLDSTTSSSTQIIEKNGNIGFSRNKARSSFYSTFSSLKHKQKKPGNDHKGSSTSPKSTQESSSITSDNSLLKDTSSKPAVQGIIKKFGRTKGHRSCSSSSSTTTTT